MIGWPFRTVCEGLHVFGWKPHTFKEFDKLVRLAQRQTNVAERIPSFYIRTLSGLEASLNNAIAKDKEAKKKMNVSNARALNGMKQKVKKINKEYETEIKRFQEVCPYPASISTILIELYASGSRRL
jgi:hypothetical protein